MKEIWKDIPEWEGLISQEYINAAVMVICRVEVLNGNMYE